MDKNAQNWSIEMIITATLFIAFFVTFLMFSFGENSNDLSEVESVADEISTQLLREDSSSGVVASGNVINKTRLGDISQLNYDELEDLFVVSKDIGDRSDEFCIIMTDENGNIIPIEGYYGFGSNKIKIGGNDCSASTGLIELRSITNLDIGEEPAISCWDESAEPKPVCSCVDLSRVRTNATTLTWNYSLQNNIDMTTCAENYPSLGRGLAANWTPIGNSTNPYTGIFDGQGFYVKGITIVGGSYLGLFGWADGTIRDLNVIDVDITADDYVGGLVGRGDGVTILSSSTTGYISADDFAGGLVGDGADVSISDSFSSATITADDHVGGLVGKSTGGTFGIDGSYATGSITGDSRVGGLIGTARDGSISSSYATGAVAGNYSLGGLAGDSERLNIQNSYAQGSISCITDATCINLGGLVGIGYQATISNSNATGSVSGYNFIGGLVGDSSAATITSGNSFGAVTGIYAGGGLLGSINGDAAGDRAGSAVSSSADGSIVAIGSPYNDDAGINSGQVRVYEYVDGVLTQLGGDIHGDDTRESLGSSVSLSSDGKTIAIGARNNTENGILTCVSCGWKNRGAGQVKVYDYVVDTWVQRGFDINGEGGGGDQSGSSVSLSSNGDILAIGAFANNPTGVNFGGTTDLSPYYGPEDDHGRFMGHTRVYEWREFTSADVGNYHYDSLQQKVDDAITNPYPTLVDITRSVIQPLSLIISNGTVPVVGQKYWIQLGVDIDGEDHDDYSGLPVSLSNDGRTVAIGAFGNENGTLAETVYNRQKGHVRVYEYTGGNWIQLGNDIDGETDYEKSGSAVSLSNDGKTVVIGAPYNADAGNDAGHARVYKYDSGIGDWSELFVKINGESAGDESGYSVSFNDDGSLLAVASPGSGSNAGKVRLFRLNDDGTRSELGCGLTSDIVGEGSGSSVSLSADGSTLLVGAIYNGEAGSNAGQVRVYDTGISSGSHSFGCGAIGGLAGDFGGGTLNGANTWVNNTGGNATSCWGSGNPTVIGSCTP